MSKNFKLSKNLTKGLKSLVFVCSLLLASLQIQAQELFFNQYLLAPMATNPGLSGASQDFWVSINHKTIPLNSGEKINTSQVSALYPIGLGNHRLVLSGSFYSDRITESFVTNGGIVGAALSLAISNKSELSFGTQASLFGTSLQENFTTDNQFTNGIFDPSTPSGETINLSPENNLSVSSGLYWHLKGNDGNVKAFAGLAMYNFTKPNVSVSDLDTDALPATYKAILGYELFRQQKLALSPSILGISRNGQQWFQTGGLLTYDIIQNDDLITSESKTTQVGIGGWYNSNQSILLSIQYKQPDVTFAINFDLPSGNGFADARKEAFEIALHYRIFKKKSNKTHKFDVQSRLETKNKEVLTPKVSEVNTNAEQTPVKKVVSEINQLEDRLAPAKIIAKPEVTDEKTTHLFLTDDEQKIINNHVRFNINSEILTTESQTYLRKVAEIFNKYKHLYIELTGHTCSLGSDEINQKLSVQRAEKVKEFLVNAGITPNRITATGKGEQEPLVENTDKMSRQVNRRVEVKIDNSNNE